jgi:uncharacterized membrane protein
MSAATCAAPRGIRKAKEAEIRAKLDVKAKAQSFAAALATSESAEIALGAGG